MVSKCFNIAIRGIVRSERDSLYAQAQQAIGEKWSCTNANSDNYDIKFANTATSPEDAAKKLREVFKSDFTVLVTEAEEKDRLFKDTPTTQITLVRTDASMNRNLKQ